MVRGGAVSGGALCFEGGLELPEAFGLGMAIADVLEAEAGEVREDDQETQHCDEYKQGRQKQAYPHAQRSFQAVKAGDLAVGVRWCVGKGHDIFNGVDR